MQESLSDAVGVILRKLNAAPRTRFELDRFLREKNFAEPTRELALDRVTEMGYIDDQAFALAWVHSRVRSRGLAPSVLQRELRAKGVDRDYIDAALADIDPESTRSRAHLLAMKKMKSLGSVSTEIATQRIYSLLLRKGYRSAEALEIAREVAGSEDLGSEEVQSEDV